MLKIYSRCETWSMDLESSNPRVKKQNQPKKNFDFTSELNNNKTNKINKKTIVREFIIISFTFRILKTVLELIK